MADEVPSSRGVVRRGWMVVQTHSGDADAINQGARADLAEGVDGVRIDLGGLSTPDELGIALEDIAPGQVAALHQANLDWVASFLVWAGEATLSTHLELDPIGTLARSGSLPGGLEQSIRAAADLARRASTLPGVRVFGVDDAAWHERGADEAWCIAISAATAVAYLRALQSAGVQPDPGAIPLRQAMPTRFLRGVAKLRATRRVWARIAELIGTHTAPEQTATPARRELTTVDPWVNILRGTTAAFAGIVGGASRIDIPPYSGEAQARRLARNTQLVLRDESRLGHVADPAGGSLAIEALTDSLAHDAWRRFQQIEAAGGAVAAVSSGWLAEQLAPLREELLRRVRTRRAPILGVSRFPDLDEKRLPPAPGSRPAAPPLAQPYEALRTRDPAPVFIATLGPLAEHTARTGFGRELLAAGGLRAEVGEVEAHSGCSVALLSCANKRFGTEALEAITTLTRSGAAVWMLGSPPPNESALRAAGVRDFVFTGGDAIATLDAIWTEVQR